MQRVLRARDLDDAAAVCARHDATRAILSGRGDELIDLAVTNVGRHLFNGRPAEVGTDAFSG
jgi:hypothetical protein